MNVINLKITNNNNLESLKNLSTERLIIWIIGKAKEEELKLAAEDIVIECWLINPEKHSLRGYNQFPDSSSVMKRIGEMKGKKGLLAGSEMSGYRLTEISQLIFSDLKELVNHKRIKEIKSHSKADRTISSIDEAPYKRLIRTPAYLKFKTGRLNEIVETDYLYFYGINWHSKTSLIQSRIKNVDMVVETFSHRDNLLEQVHVLLNKEYSYVKQKLLKLD